MASELETHIGFAIPPVPLQGTWTEEDYFRVETNHFVELVNGHLEVLPMPTWLHQAIVDWLADQLKAWNKVTQVGKVLFAPVPLKLFERTIREPDILFVPRPRTSKLPRYPTMALMVVEVVSEVTESRKRDVIDKRADYAKASIPEYWIVDPIEKAVTVLKLENDNYTLHGRFEQNQTATAATLQGFSINCGEIWALENEV